MQFNIKATLLGMIIAAAIQPMQAMNDQNITTTSGEGCGEEKKLTENEVSVEEARRRQQQANDSLLFNAKFGDVKRMAQALKNGADIDCLDRDGVSPLANAVYFADLGAVKFLIEHGANVNIRMRHGTTPLHVAAADKPGGKKDYVEMVALLVEHGADINGVLDSGQTPSTIALDLGHEGVAVYLRYCDLRLRKKTRIFITPHNKNVVPNYILLELAGKNPVDIVDIMKKGAAQYLQSKDNSLEIAEQNFMQLNGAIERTVNKRVREELIRFKHNVLPDLIKNQKALVVYAKPTTSNEKIFLMQKQLHQKQQENTFSDVEFVFNK